MFTNNNTQIKCPVADDTIVLDSYLPVCGVGVCVCGGGGEGMEGCFSVQSPLSI